MTWPTTRAHQRRERAQPFTDQRRGSSCLDSIGRVDSVAGTRQQRKQRTRETILSAALALVETQSLATLPLRRLTRAVGIVPTASYRRFTSVDELGLALVDESFASLRT